MMKTFKNLLYIALMLSTAGLASAQNLGGIFGGPSRGILNGTSDPATCQPTTRNIFINRNSTPVLKICTAANVWTDLITTSGGTFTGPILAADGTAAAPSYSFASAGNNDNGLYLFGANALGFSTAGTARWAINASGALVAATDGGVDIGNGASDPRDLNLTRNVILRGATSGTSTLHAPAVAGTADITLPGATGTLSTLAGTETLENKTLTAPTATAVNITDSALSFNGAQLQGFGFHIVNTGGTLQHKIVGESTSSTASSFAGKIIGASVTLANTPTVDGVTAFVSGAGINSTGTNQIIFNTAAQTNSKFFAMCIVEVNTTATSGLTCSASNASSDVNGVTVNRLIIGFRNTSGAHALTTANIGASTFIRARVIAFIE